MTQNSQKKRRHIIKPSRLVFLIVLLAGNTFAWFIYATKINSDVTVHVRAWNVVFQSGDSQLTNYIPIDVQSIYPGMEDFEYEVTAYNRSEVSASLTYQVLSARILDDEYVTVEEKQRLGLTVEQDDITAAELEEMLAEDFPFTIAIETSNNTISSGTGSETYTLTVTWPYESNDDELDTEWGVAAYDYMEDNPTEPSIQINVLIVITQSAS